MSLAKPTALLIAVTLLPLAARAEPIWGYRSPTNTSVQTPGEAAGLSFPNTPWADAPAAGPITAIPVVSWSAAPIASPDRVDGEFYTFDLEVKDHASGLSGTLEFAGVLTGALWKDGVSLTNTFVGPTALDLDLGASRYTVALDAFEAPTGFGEGKAGRITADVTVTALGDPALPAEGETDPAAAPPEPTAAQTPEPGSVVLIGMALVAGAGWARVRRPTPPTVHG